MRPCVVMQSTGQHVGSSKRLMLAHFEKKHQYDCEEWAKETLKGMTLGLFGFGLTHPYVE